MMTATHMSPLRRQRGVTLIELMVGMLVGLLILMAVSTIYISTIRSSADTLAAARLNQELRAAMSIIAGDLRRAGYWNQFEEADNPFDNGVADVEISGDGQCVVYAYDLSNDGEIGANERFAMRRVIVDQRGVMQMWNGNAGATLANCNDAANSADWIDLVGGDGFVNLLNVPGEDVFSQEDLCFNLDDPTDHPNALSCLDAALPAGSLIRQVRHVVITLEGRAQAASGSRMRVTERVRLRNDLHFRAGTN